MTKKNAKVPKSIHSVRTFNDPIKAYKRELRKKRLNSFIRSAIYFLILILFTMYALYSDDLRLACTEAKDDVIWSIFTIITIVFFLLSVCVNAAFNPNYWKTISFYAEILALLSLILDITWLWNNTALNNWSATSTNLIPVLISVIDASNRSRSFVWVMMYIRFIRFMFLISLFNGMAEKIDSKEDKDMIEKREQIAEGNKQAKLNNHATYAETEKNRLLKYPTIDFDFEIQNEIEGVSKKGSDSEIEVHNTSRSFTYSNTKRAMFGNILLMMVMPIFLYQTFSDRLSMGQAGVTNQLEYLLKNKYFQNASQINSFMNLTRVQDSVIKFIMPVSVSVYQYSSSSSSSGTTTKLYGNYDPIFYSNQTVTTTQEQYGFKEIEVMKTKRPYEYLVMTTPSDLSTLVSGDVFVIAIYDNRHQIIIESGIGIAKTTLVIFVFLLTIYLFINDSKKLLLGPFADMMKKIKNIEENPMTAAREMEIEIAEQEKAAETNSSLRKDLAELRKYETNILTNTLAKSGQLLALGFGEAGINLIMEKLKKGSEMVGKKVICLFGFADIKMFTEVSDKLKEDVITFINEIANILSPIVDYHTGGTNKNLGEAFLFVWKFRDEDTTTVFDYDPEGKLRKNVKLKEFADKNNSITSRCDLALLSFIKCIIQVHQAPNMDKYKYDERLKSIKNFKVKNSFGLHIGWGIEGAIGSEYKIDASYLSPNVNLASRVQYATKQFGVYVLISGMVYDLLSTEIQILMREIDCVELKGSKLAMHLWTYDMDLSCLEVKHFKPMKEENKKIYDKVVKERMTDYRKKINKFHEDFYNGKIIGKDCFLYDTNVIKVHQKFTEKFYQHWNTGYSLYIDGKWKEAAPYFESTLVMLPDYHDKPSEVILSFLKAADYKKPSYWKGVRHLTSK